MYIYILLMTNISVGIEISYITSFKFLQQSNIRSFWQKEIWP